MNNYYEENAQQYIKNTIDCDMSTQYKFFLKYMKPHSTILDVGFGSGRDMKYFQSIGHNVMGIDPTQAFMNNMKDYQFILFPYKVEKMKFRSMFDGIWACASLLHINSKYMNKALINCEKALKENGFMYASFKYGDFEGKRNGRYFIDMTEEKIRNYIQKTNLFIIETLITFDVRPERQDEKWLNIILKKGRS